MRTPALIALGSNLGDRRALLEAAIAALGGEPGVEIRTVSSFHETAPVGGPAGQGAYLNAAAAIDTTLDPLDLLRRLQEIERRAGRVRTFRWGERTIDLDLLLYGDQVLRLPELTIPHPRMAVRRFVLAPLAEIVPEEVDPVTGRSIGWLLANLDRRPSHVALQGPLGDDAGDVFWQVVDGLVATAILRPDDLPDQPVSDRWLVSDFRLGAIPVARDPRFAPTFVVAGPEVGRIRDDIPVLALESSDPDSMVAEILAACAATRS